MIQLETLRQDILGITPQGRLERSDFEKIAAAAEPIIASKGKLRGLMISMGSFPGWRNVAALSAHLKFIARHQRRIERIAVVTDRRLQNIVPRMAGFLLHPDIRVFGAGQAAVALSWLETGR